MKERSWDLAIASICFMVSTSSMPMRSKRKPSMPYSSIQYWQQSTIIFLTIARSEARSLPQPEVEAILPFRRLRKK